MRMIIGVIEEDARSSDYISCRYVGIAGIRVHDHPFNLNSRSGLPWLQTLTPKP